MNKARLGTVVWAVVAAGTAAACGGGATTAKAPETAQRAVAATGRSCRATSAARPVSGRAQSSSALALAKIGGRRVAFVADEDAKAILTVDVDTRTELAETPVSGTPAHVLVTGDGRVFATLRDTSEVVVLAASRADAPLTEVCAAKAPAEPIALVATPDETSILVTSGWGKKLSAFDAASLTVRFDVDLGREPRAVVVADDGKTAFVSHAVGSVVTAVDLGGAHEAKTVSMRGFDGGQLQLVKQQRAMAARMKKSVAPELVAKLDSTEKRLEGGRPSCQGFALAKSSQLPGRVFAPQVMVDPGDLEQRPDGYGDENSQTEAPAVAVLDEGAAAPLPTSVTLGRDISFAKRLRGDTRDAKPECLLPRAATIDDKTKSLLVTCYGIDSVIAYDATAANPLGAERRRWTVGSGPSGIAVDVDKHRAVVWSQFDRTIATFAIGGTEIVDEKTAPPIAQKTTLPPLRQKLPAEYALGRILFHAAGDARISSDGRACASCHPDGRDDAITWATPEGPRRSIMLAGRATSTPPYSWNGNETSIHNHLGNTFDRLGGKGLRSIELDALVTYVSTMPAPPTAAPAEPAVVARGKQIFASAEAGCAGCHAGANGTDGKNHDVSSKHKADRGAAFNTPSLRFVGGTGPYFHDGRYATLGELLDKSDGKMGRTGHLSAKDRAALEAYLRTL